MAELYRVHFGFSKSKKYPQAVELAQLAHRHEIIASGVNKRHIASFRDDQIDLMASLYKIARNLPKPKVDGADILYLIVYCHANGNYNYAYASTSFKNRIRRVADKLQLETEKSLPELSQFLKNKYLKPYQEDMLKVYERLVKEAYLDSTELVTGNMIKATQKPKEHIAEYREIRELISNENYEEAIKKYYMKLGDNFYGELHNELIYLKRLSNIHLIGRDLLFFRNKSSINELINSNFLEYCSCIDSVLAQYRETGLRLPSDVLIENAPTMNDLIEQRKQDWHFGVFLCDGELERDNTTVTIDSFSAHYDKCPEGRLFDKYPDQVQHCKIIDAPEDKAFKGLWTAYSFSYYQRQILDRGFHLNGIEAYRHKLWKGKKREPDFTSAASLKEIEKNNYGTDGISYSGRSHKIDENIFYEIDLLRKNVDLTKELGNPFIELVEEILREAENLLRENHGLPRIGEGWVSEMQLFNLVKIVFSDTQHHISPAWLKPQHLDVFVPSKKLAFEYQGRQHFEPIDFFGGEETFEKTKKLDRQKMRKCKSNSVSLIYWHFDEPINQDMLVEKLKHFDINRENSGKVLNHDIRDSKG